MGLAFNTPLEIMSFDKDIMTLSDGSKARIVSGRPPGWNPKDRVVLSKQQAPERKSSQPGHDFSGARLFCPGVRRTADEDATTAWRVARSRCLERPGDAQRADVWHPGRVVRIERASEGSQSASVLCE